MSDQTFHFTLGPVQGFVAQARRTRDFWAGSFLLSWLAGAAMVAVREQDGEINFPTPQEDDLEWLTGVRTGSGGPRQGGIPNRFKAIKCKVPDTFEPERVEQTVRAAWTALADAVWQRDDLENADARTQAIWNRQVDGFWEITWALSADETDNGLLDRRKNWRSHLPPEEGGVKCSMMAGWQELSGAERPGDARLETFWAPIRQKHPRDFDDQETLCAIAFIKRRFVGAFSGLKAAMPDGWTLHGWQIDGQMPSTSDLAAAHWVAGLDTTDSRTLEQLRDATVDLLGEKSDRGLGLLRCVRQSAQARVLAAIHTPALFEHVRENQRLCPDRKAARAVVQALRRAGSYSSPSPFYAILLMDGDRLGQLLQTDPQAPAKISRALDRFTHAVPGVVDENNGFLVYAGGDDVLALLPLDDALHCAGALRVEYLGAFREAFGTDHSPSTLSAAITFAHVKSPLTRLLRDSHRLLDDVAKEATGRDALAVRVLKPSGETLQWARPWEQALSREDPERLVIEQLATQFAAVSAGEEEADFSSKFFYRIRERFAFLNPTAQQQAAGIPPVFTPEQCAALLAADYLASGENRARGLNPEKITKLIQPLLDQCFPVRRSLSEQGEVSFTRQGFLEADAALLVRFLAQKGKERA